MEKDTTSTSLSASTTHTPCVMTVLGPLSAGADLGHVLMNEHLVCEPTKKKRGRATTTDNNNLRMSLEYLSAIRSQPLDCVDNMTLYSEHEVMSELQHLKTAISSSSHAASASTAAPIITVLDVANATDGRDLKSSVSISRRLGIHVIVGTSCGGCGDTETTTTTNSSSSSNGNSNDQEGKEGDKMERDIAHMEQELLHGISPTSNPNHTNGEAATAITNADDSPVVRAGFIGQVLLSESFPSSEQHELRACAIVQCSTKALLLVAAPAMCVIQVLDQIEASGGDLRQTVLAHMDLYCKNNNNDLSLVRNVLDRGAVISLDRFSVSAACFDFDGDFPTIADVVRCIASLLHANPAYVHQIVLSSGIFMRLQYRKYGGAGYSVLQQELLPRLLSARITPDQIHTMVQGNPRRLLEWWTPPPAPVKPIEYLTCSVCHHLFEPVLGEYLTKYTFTYCGRVCLRKHVQMKFKPVPLPPPPTTTDGS